MTNNSDPNIYPVIELKKSLKRTIIQLQKAIDILNQNSPEHLPNLTVVEDLVKSSNALVDYLQLKNADEKGSTNETTSQDNAIKFDTNPTVEKLDNLERKKVKVSVKKQFSPLTIKPNFWLTIFLFISISFNIFNLINSPFFLKNNTTFANQEMIKDKSQEIEIGNNIFLKDKTENSQEQVKTAPEKPFEIGENIFQEEIDSSEIEEKQEKKEQNKSINHLQQDSLLGDNLINSQENNSNQEQKSTNVSLQEEQKQVTDFKEETEKSIDNNKDEERAEEFSLLELSPEKYILKNIENQIDKITKKYGDNLIIQVKANFSENNITITLSDKWYSLSANQQNNFANDIFNRVKSLDLYRFKLENQQGKVLARNAVVGDRIIILP